MQPLHLYILIVATLLLASPLVQGERLGEGLAHHRKLFLAPLASAILDRYIIVLNNRSSKALDNVRTILSRSGAQTDYEYDGDFTAFVVSGLVSKFLDLILRDDDVEFVEQVCVHCCSFRYIWIQTLSHKYIFRTLSVGSSCQGRYDDHRQAR